MKKTNSLQNKKTLFLSLLLGASFSLVSCVVLPDTGKQTLILSSPQDEAKMGIAAFSQIKKQMKKSGSTSERARIGRVIRRIIPHVGGGTKNWEYEVFADNTPNAFAVPGGKIGVHTGILKIAKTDGQLAAIIGHECAHVSQRHSGQRYTRQTGASLGMLAAGILIGNSSQSNEKKQAWMSALGTATNLGVVLPFSRSDESEADAVGLIYMAKAGYHPKEAIDFWKNMAAYGKGKGKPPEFLSTHPADATRIRQLQDLLPRAMQYYKKR